MITSTPGPIGRTMSLLAVGAATLLVTACTPAGSSVVSATTTQSIQSTAPTSSEAPRTTIDSAAVAASASAAKAAADQLAAASSQAAASAAAAAAAEQAAAEQAAQAAAAQAAADQSAAESAAASAAAEQSAAEEAAQQAAAAAAEQAAAEQSAAEQSAAEQAEEDSGADGWYTPSGNWVSRETAARAIAAGISPGDTVPNYLRCGTICGEGPTSGEVQWAHLCKDGQVPAEECAGIDPDAIIAAASSYAG